MRLNKGVVRRSLAIALMVVGVAACQEPVDDATATLPNDSTETVTPEMMAEIEGTPWTLVSYDQTPVIAGSKITLTLADGRLNGSAGCNQYFADYQLIDGQLVVDAAGTTKIACEPELMQQESAYLRLLQQADNVIAASEDTLTIETPEGNLIFEMADTAAS